MFEVCRRPPSEALEADRRDDLATGSLFVSPYVCQQEAVATLISGHSSQASGGQVIIGNASCRGWGGTGTALSARSEDHLDHKHLHEVHVCLALGRQSFRACELNEAVALVESRRLEREG